MSYLLVFSHVRWGFVYQRPQHLMSRLSRHYKVLFIEEPVHDQAPAHLACERMNDQLEVWVPHTPVCASGFHDKQLFSLQALVDQALAARGITDYLVWLFTPMALPLIASLVPRALVYDCMNDLSALAGAPLQLLQRERSLMKRADVVLTGGPSLYDAKRGQNANLHCLPSAVDVAHFSPGGLMPDSEQARAVMKLHEPIRGPRLGYFGVIDERLDIELLDTVARNRSAWQFVMVGPVVNIDPATLPHRPNIHWLGMQSYGRLPYFLAGWDVCLMPFATNESTRFISPTQTLEYMAGEKPVVSTPVADVVRLYGAIVRIAADPQTFTRACVDAMAEIGPRRIQRMADMADAVSTFSWDRSAEHVHGLLQAVLESRPADAREPPLPPMGRGTAAPRRPAELRGKLAS